jgi:hypothetical protein
VLHDLLSGRSAVWLAHLNGVQGVGGSNPLVPTIFHQKESRSIFMSGFFC